MAGGTKRGREAAGQDGKEVFHRVLGSPDDQAHRRVSPSNKKPKVAVEPCKQQQHQQRQAKALKHPTSSRHKSRATSGKLQAQSAKAASGSAAANKGSAAGGAPDGARSQKGCTATPGGSSQTKKSRARHRKDQQIYDAEVRDVDTARTNLRTPELAGAAKTDLRKAHAKVIEEEFAMARRVFVRVNHAADRHPQHFDFHGQHQIGAKLLLLEDVDPQLIKTGHAMVVTGQDLHSPNGCTMCDIVKAHYHGHPLAFACSDAHSPGRLSVNAPPYDVAYSLGQRPKQVAAYIAAAAQDAQRKIKDAAASAYFLSGDHGLDWLKYV
ncbi:hypothetical protein JKP88DRAFT_245844 [Tribonema minus]|uniref:Uncharacterized protein n=1 Tax=Tribonema minus TaxID=303371 RepID=A0A835YWD5_9STRA|nr:hypothetical protein JKP88DRAFT_245844 [Tribonema minus]